MRQKSVWGTTTPSWDCQEKHTAHGNGNNPWAQELSPIPARPTAILFPHRFIPSSFLLSSTPDAQRPFAAVMLLVFAMCLCPQGAGDLPVLLSRCGASGNSAPSPQPALSIGHGEHPVQSCRWGPTAKGSRKVHTHSTAPELLCTPSGHAQIKVTQSGAVVAAAGTKQTQHPPIHPLRSVQSAALLSPTSPRAAITLRDFRGF